MSEYVSKVACMDTPSVVEVCNDEQELICDEEMKLRKVPALAQLGVPLKPAVIKVIIKEVTILSNQFPKKKLLSYTNWGGSTSQLLNVPVCKNQESFARMNRKRRFIDNLPKYICGNDNLEQEEEVSGWIIQRLSTLHEEQFLKCADEMGYPLSI